MTAGIQGNDRDKKSDDLDVSQHRKLARQECVKESLCYTAHVWISDVVFEGCGV